MDIVESPACMLLESLFGKLRLALRNQECQSCRRRLGDDRLFCEQCLTGLGVRDAQPLVHLEHFEAHAATLFNARLKRILYGYKFYGKRQHADLFSGLLTHYWRQLACAQVAAAQVTVVPVPAHPGRQDLISPFARRFASDFGYGYADGLLCWQRDAEPQHTILAKRRRLENVADAMAVSPDRALKLPTSARTRRGLVLVVDDLMTTGATMREAITAVRRSQVFEGQVMGLALCHMPLALHRSVLAKTPQQSI